MDRIEIADKISDLLEYALNHLPPNEVDILIERVKGMIIDMEDVC